MWQLITNKAGDNLWYYTFPSQSSTAPFLLLSWSESFLHTTHHHTLPRMNKSCYISWLFPPFTLDYFRSLPTLPHLHRKSWGCSNCWLATATVLAKVWIRLPFSSLVLNCPKLLGTSFPNIFLPGLDQSLSEGHFYS